MPSGAAKDQGVRYGERAADRILALRVDDGRFSPLKFDVPLAPGVWRPTPTGLAPFFGPPLVGVEGQSAAHQSLKLANRRNVVGLPQRYRLTSTLR